MKGFTLLAAATLLGGYAVDAAYYPRRALSNSTLGNTNSTVPGNSGSGQTTILAAGGAAVSPGQAGAGAVAPAGPGGAAVAPAQGAAAPANQGNSNAGPDVAIATETVYVVNNAPTSPTVNFPAYNPNSLAAAAPPACYAPIVTQSGSELTLYPSTTQIIVPWTTWVAGPGGAEASPVVGEYTFEAVYTPTTYVYETVVAGTTYTSVVEVPLTTTVGGGGAGPGGVVAPGAHATGTTVVGGGGAIVAPGSGATVTTTVGGGLTTTTVGQSQGSAISSASVAPSGSPSSMLFPSGVYANSSRPASASGTSSAPASVTSSAPTVIVDDVALLRSLWRSIGDDAFDAICYDFFGSASGSAMENHTVTVTSTKVVPSEVPVNATTTAVVTKYDTIMEFTTIVTQNVTQSVTVTVETTQTPEPIREIVMAAKRALPTEAAASFSQIAATDAAAASLVCSSAVGTVRPTVTSWTTSTATQTDVATVQQNVTVTAATLVQTLTQAKNVTTTSTIGVTSTTIALTTTTVEVCPLLETMCDGYCADLLTDTNNCGECGNWCLFGCSNGACIDIPVQLQVVDNGGFDDPSSDAWTITNYGEFINSAYSDEYTHDNSPYAFGMGAVWDESAGAGSQETQLVTLNQVVDVVADVPYQLTAYAYFPGLSGMNCAADFFIDSLDNLVAEVNNYNSPENTWVSVTGTLYAPPASQATIMVRAVCTIVEYNEGGDPYNIYLDDIAFTQAIRDL
ncbi:hypothetical protein YB2330_004973 [Saitoella coloradoensis]